MTMICLVGIITIRRIGKMLKALREQKGLTQIELARKAKIDQSYLARLESGDRSNPSLEKIQMLAKALKVKVAELVE